MPTQTVVNVAQADRGPGLFTFDAPQPIPAGLRFATFEIILPDSDKLAVGNQLDIQFFLSPDGVQPYVFCNGTTWISYGPNGFTITDVTGTRVNPNPRINVSLVDAPGNPRVGFYLRGSINLAQQLFAGALITITS